MQPKNRSHQSPWLDGAPGKMTNENGYAVEPTAFSDVTLDVR